MSNKMKGDKLRQTCIDLKLRGCAPLFAGDLLFSTGTFMRHCEHKEFKYNDLPDGTPEKTHQIIRRYPATTIASRQQLHQPDLWINAPQTDGTDTKQNRGVVTFRKTDNHWHSPRCPELWSRKRPAFMLRLLTAQPVCPLATFLKGPCPEEPFRTIVTFL